MELAATPITIKGNATRDEDHPDFGPALVAGTALVTTALPTTAAAQKVLTIGMTAADIPRTLGHRTRASRATASHRIPIYDSLTQWDLSVADGPSVLIPGLATEWAVNPDDTTKWTFTLRDGVTFHDGSPVNAEAVVWNVEKVLDQEALHFDASQVGVTASRMPTLRSASAIDELTVELTTSEPDAFLPLNLTNLFIARRRIGRRSTTPSRPR
jgi:ABC-type transport system substrate-binding protein